MLVTILIIVLILMALGGGGWGYSKYGMVGMSPAVVILLVLVALYFTGHLGAR